jgi:hypothetical protein
MKTIKIGSYAQKFLQLNDWVMIDVKSSLKNTQHCGISGCT